VRLWDAETGECLRVLEGHPVGVVAAAFSQDQRHAFSCDWSGGIGVWDLELS
jgi:WD40 repeat protein